MTDRYDAGEFVAAAIAGDETLAMLRDGDGVVVGIGVQYQRDRLWAGLEKAKILQDAARFQDSLDAYTWVYAEQDWLAEIESNYAENPLDPSNWNAGQFLEDAGQAVVGADQTDYIVQPYEAILTASYASLVAMMLDEPRAADFARQSMTLQGQWRENLGLDLVEVRDAASPSIDSGLASRNPQLSGFSIASILNLDQFGKARSEMRQVVEAAAKAGAASPFLPAASLVNWAAFVKNDRYSDAITAVEGFRAFSGNASLASELEAVMNAPVPSDKVLVLVGAGRGPARDSFSVRVPVPIPSVGTGYFRGVYPVLKFRDGPSRPSRVTVAGAPLAVVGSVDAVAAQDFSRREPSLWWLPTFRGVLRAAASIAAQAATDSSDSWMGAVITAVNVVVAEAEQPDLRMWTSLPGVFFASLVDRPRSGMLDISLEATSGANAVQVEVPNGLSFVYVRSLEPGLTVAHVASLRAGSGQSVAGGAAVESAMPSPSAEVEAEIEVVVSEADRFEQIAEEYARRVRRGTSAEQARQALALGSKPAFEIATRSRTLGPSIDSGDGVVRIAAPRDRHAMVKLIDRGDPARCLAVFVPMGRSSNLRVVPGEYDLMIATGASWYGWQLDFGPDAEYFAAADGLDLRSEGSTAAMEVSLRPGGTRPRLVQITRESFD